MLRRSGYHFMGEQFPWELGTGIAKLAKALVPYQQVAIRYKSEFHPADQWDYWGAHRHLMLAVDKDVRGLLQVVRLRFDLPSNPQWLTPTPNRTDLQNWL